jgi:long-subunit acyl-CoA synthetase (AMP-forming)
MITHAALVATIAGCNQYLTSFNETLGPEDSYLSFLPLAHVFDRCVICCCSQRACIFLELCNRHCAAGTVSNSAAALTQSSASSLSRTIQQL